MNSKEWRDWIDGAEKNGIMAAGPLRELCSDLEAAEARLEEATRTVEQAVLVFCQETTRADAAEARAEALETALRDAINSVRSGYLASIGAIHNTYTPQIGVEQVERWDAALTPPEAQGREEGK